MRPRLFAVVAASFLFSSVITASPTAPIALAATTTTGLFSVGAIQSQGAPVGCISVGCENVAREIAAYSPRTEFPELGNATEISSGQATSASGSSLDGGCAIVSGGLRCWGGNKYGQLGDETTIDSVSTLVTALEGGVPLSGVTDVMTGMDATCVVASGALKCIGRGFGTDFYDAIQQDLYTRVWKTIIPVGVLKVGSMGGWTGGSVCIIKVDETYWCATGSMPYTWVDSGFTNVKDVSGPCVAGLVSYCISFSNGSFSLLRQVENGGDAEAVYYQANAICFYRLGALWCASQGGSTLSARLVGVMPKPLAILNKMIGVTSPQMFFILPTGILTTLTSMISCDNCYTSANGVVSRLSAFQNSTSTTFQNIISVNGLTNSLDYIPLTTSSGNRVTRTAVPITVKTTSGEPVASASIRWNAPDAPGTLSSGSTSIVTDTGGGATATVGTGPVSFTVQGGTLKSGATLQAAIVTTTVPDTGAVDVIVPDPPGVVDRKVTVVMSDATPVPSAVITIKNAYLAYSYRFAGTDVATWGAQAKDPKGYFGQVWCTWCFVPPPAYITGADGSITFKTFDTGARSTNYDVDIAYNDGSLAETLKHSFATTSDTVTMKAMAKTVAAINDADPSTATIEVPVSSSGTATIEVVASNSTDTKIEGLAATVEDVCAGMDTGGLWKAGLEIENICRDVSSVSVRAQSVERLGSCSPTTSATSGADGKLTLILCPLKSTKYRLRGKGAVATRAFCVVVASLPCATGATQQTTQSKVAAPVRRLKRNTSSLLRQFLRPTKGARFSYRATGRCTIVGQRLKAAARTGSCRLVMTQVIKKKRTTRSLIIKIV